MNDQKLAFDKFFKCQLYTNDADAHLLKEPKVLPCGYTVCSECIRKLIKTNNNKIFKCNFENCKQEHQINDINNLGQNHLVETVLNENLKYLSHDLLQKLENEYESFKKQDVLDEKKIQIETIFEFIESDIIIRVESIKNELELLQNDLISTIKSIKGIFFENFLHEYEFKKSKYEKFIDNLKNLFITNEASNEILKTNMYTCQEYLNELKKFDVNLNVSLNEISFENSDWLPCTKNIGIINAKSILYTISKTVSPRIIDLGCCIKHAYGICSMKDNYLAITSPDENKVYILDKNYHFIKACASVGGRFFNKPFGICSDRQSNVYLCDFGNNRVIILDETFEEVRKVIGKQGTAHGEFNGPVDICYENDRLYVLDSKNKRIQELSRRGEFLKEIDFTTNQLVTEPVRLGVISDTIAVLDDFKDLVIYNTDGQLIQVIETDNISSFYLNEDYCLTFSNECKIVLFKKSNEKKSDRFIIEFERELRNFERFETTFTCFFNDHLMVALGECASLAEF